MIKGDLLDFQGKKKASSCEEAFLMRLGLGQRWQYANVRSTVGFGFESNDTV
jgi:hypothetical protein